MGDPFVPNPQNIQAAIGILMAWSYSKEYLISIEYNRELAEDEMMFDVPIALELLGARLPCREDFKDLN